MISDLYQQSNLYKMKKVVLFFVLSVSCYSCIDKVKKQYQLDEFQQRDDDLFYYTSTQDLLTGTIVLRKDTYEVRNGLLNGKHQKFHSNGQLNVLNNYEDGFLTGELKQYSYNGDIEIEGQLEKGQRIGTWNIYTDNGDSIYYYFTNKKDFSVKGKLVSGQEIDYIFKEGLVIKGTNQGGYSDVGKTESCLTFLVGISHDVYNFGYKRRNDISAIEIM